MEHENDPRKLVQKLKDMGLTLQEIASRLNVTPSAVWKVENGKTSDPGFRLVDGLRRLVGEKEETNGNGNADA